MTYEEYCNHLDEVYQGDIPSPTWRRVIWEEAYTMQEKELKEIGTRKVNWLEDLESIDLMSMPEKQAKKISKQIYFLKKELNELAGILLMTENLNKAYLDTTAWLADYYFRQEQKYLKKIEFLQQKIERAKNFNNASEA